MQTLSRNKKIGIFSLVILGITLIVFIWTGNVDMSRLSSSVLNGSTYICTENGQKRNLNEYNKAIRDKQQSEGKIKIMSGEISTLNTTIAENKKTIATREETIKNQNTTIGELTAYISKNCANPKTSREKTVCTQKKQQKTNLEQSNKNLSNQITSLNTLIGRLEWQIRQKNENIATWTKKIEEYTKYIKEYDTCTESLKGKLIITSPLMSGEVKMALEVGKRAELYKFSMSMPATGKAEINEIKFDTAFGPGNIELDEWYITENSTATSIYPCRLENNGQFRCALERIESGNFGLENGRVQNYSLSAVVKDIKEPGNFKIYGISKEGVLYNGTRRDTDNQSTPVKINYLKPVIALCGNGIKDANEQCDDGNTNNDDSCNNLCQLSKYVITVDIDKSTYTIKNQGSIEIPFVWKSTQPNKNPYIYILNESQDNSNPQWWAYASIALISQKWSLEGVGNTFTDRFKPITTGNYKLVVCDQSTDFYTPTCGASKVFRIQVESTSTCDALQGSTSCLKQDGCYYNEKTSKCTSEALKCEDASDAQDDIFTKGMIWWFARHVYSPRYYQASYDYCTGDTINQVSCDSEDFAKYTSTTCPNGCSDGVCKNITTGNLLISLSSNSPQMRAVSGNQTVTAADFEFKAENKAYTIKSISLKIASSIEAQSIVSVAELYDGAQSIWFVALSSSQPSASINTSIAIPANTTKILTVKVPLNVIGIGAGISWSNTPIILDSVTYEDDSAIQKTDSTDIFGNTFYVYKAVPAIAQVPVNNTTKITNGSTRDILKLNIFAPKNTISPSGISIKQIRFPLSWVDGGSSGDALEVESLKFYENGVDITSSVLMQDEDGNSVESTSGLLESDDSLYITWNSTLEGTIPAGAATTYTVRGTFQWFNNNDQSSNPGDSFSIGFLPDTTHNDALKYLSYANTNSTLVGLYKGAEVPSAIVPYNFIWSDLSAVPHTWSVGSSSSNDWANSYLIFSPFQEQIFTNG